MAIGPFLCTFGTAAFLLLSAPAWSAEEAPSSPATAGQPAAGSVDEARALVKAGRFNEALVLLRPFVERGAIETDVLFLIGLASTGASQTPGVTEESREALLDGAIAAFRSILIYEPGLVRVRLELGFGLFSQGRRTTLAQATSSGSWPAGRRPP